MEINKKIISMLLLFILIATTFVSAYGGGSSGTSTYVRASQYDNFKSKITFKNKNYFVVDLDLPTMSKVEFNSKKKQTGSIEIIELDDVQALNIFDGLNLIKMYKIDYDPELEDVILALTINSQEDKNYNYQFLKKIENGSWIAIPIGYKEDGYIADIRESSFLALIKEETIKEVKTENPKIKPKEKTSQIEKTTNELVSEIDETEEKSNTLYWIIIGVFTGALAFIAYMIFGKN